MNNRIEYTVPLKDGTKLRFWFIGSQIEKILNDYNIPYTKKEVEYGSK